MKEREEREGRKERGMKEGRREVGGKERRREEGEREQRERRVRGIISRSCSYFFCLVQQATGISTPHGGSRTDTKNRLRVSPPHYCIIKTVLVHSVHWLG